ncbi:PIR Superfamily Protein [Plasmodium ovale wallikeri]|uniref:PIR protein n=2 Tax=Plasmodium ovale TaxID=36330 RepID=A0A1C3KKA9_PLAOA|nr:PIR Superfamily Protein [Plasmodium ovale wallikeri]SBT74376.1 PIR protein [Plasmodium ovale]
MSGGNYSFFSNFSYYEDMENSLLSVGISEKSSCDSFLKDSFFIHIPFPDVFCEQFKKLYNILLNRTVNNKEPDTLENIDCAFLNYWLNNKLRGINIDTSICVNDFYNKIKAKNADIFKNTLLEKKLYNIEKHDLEKMRTLYDLYNIKSQINTALSEDSPMEKRASCSGYTYECYKKYINAIIKCKDGCSYFYSLLTEFKNKYIAESTPFVNSSSSCNYKELFELPDYKFVLKQNNSGQFKRILTLPVLFPLLGVFFTFIFSDTITPFRQMLLEKIKRTKNMLFDVVESDEELLSYTSNNDNISEDQLVYNVSYYSV